MTTKQYIKKYKLDVPGYANHFNTDLFLADLNEEWHQRMEKEKAYRKSLGQQFEFRMFQRLVVELQQKFSAISNKKAEGPLRRELWNAFYAKYIIPVRGELFPKEHEEIRIKRIESQRAKFKEQYKNEEILKMGEKFQSIKLMGGQVYKDLLAQLERDAQNKAEKEFPI